MNLQTSKPNRFISVSTGHREKLWRNNIILLLSLFVLIFIAPLMGQFGKIVTHSALILVVISGIFAADYQKQIFKLLFSLGFLTLISMASSYIFPGSKALDIISFLLTTISLIFSTTALIAHVSRANSVEKSTVLCAINSYLLMGLTASILFISLDLFVPSSFITLEAGSENLSSYIYFGFVTLSTVGYGDITPTAPLARSLSIFVAVGGQLYLVIVIALIIGKFLNTQRQK
jgi:hypothetical protein